MTQAPHMIPSRVGANSKSMVAKPDYSEYLKFQFLPNDITFAKSTVWNLPEVPGRQYIVAQYVAGGQRTVGFSIDLRSLRSDYVEDFLSKFQDITEGKEFILTLGYNQSFRCVLTEGYSIDSVRYTYITPGRDSGTIGQAKLKVSCVILEDLSVRGF